MEDSVEYFVEDDEIESDIENPYRITQTNLKGSSILDNDIPDNYDFDLILPIPNPLMKKIKQTPEPLRIIYKYPFKKLAKFEGKEKVENGNYIGEQLSNYKFKRYNNPESSTEYEKIEKYFPDEDKIIYARNKGKPNDSFNSNYFNIKKYFKSKEELCKGIRKKKQKTRYNSSQKNIADDNNSKNDLNFKYYDYYYQPKSLDDKTLIFESRFESGNLSMVSKVSDHEYNLLLQNDVNTNGYIQWFFFEMNNTTKGMNIKFNILNFVKSDSIFNHGMKILIYSRKEYQNKKTGWFRGGNNITYYKNNILRETRDTNTIKTYRTLSFEYEFTYNDDQVYFAYTYPYTYTELNEYLDQLEDDPDISKSIWTINKDLIIVRAPLCRTIAGNLCEVLTISNHPNPNHIHKKKCILLIGRVHPGETVSSYTIKGVIDFLTSKKEEANALRENFVFKIIPMLNPDGVIHGNYRCDLAGCDLNRRWRKPANLIHPTVFGAKRLIENILEKYKIAMFCDFHGHSRKFNTFFYACSEPKNPYKSREFPFIMSRICPLFSYRDCSFVAHPYKKRTARVTLFEEYKTFNSLCLETSFFGSNKTRKHFTRDDLETIGHKFCESLLLYFCINPKNPVPLPKENQNNNSNPNILKKKNGEQSGIENFNQLQLKREFLEDLYANEENLNFGNRNEVSDSDSGDSEDGLLKDILVKFIPKIGKTKNKNLKQRQDSYSFLVNENLNTKKTSKSLPKNKIPDNIKNSLTEKEIIENIKLLQSKVVYSLSPTKSMKNLAANLRDETPNLLDQEVSNCLSSDKNDEFSKKSSDSRSQPNLRKSFSGKINKLPIICTQDNSSKRTSIKGSQIIEGEYKKPILYNYCDYLQKQNIAMISNEIQESNYQKIDRINKIYIKKVKGAISKEPLIPKDFICDFKGVQQSNTPFLQQNQAHHWRSISRRLELDLFPEKDFLNNNNGKAIIQKIISNKNSPLDDNEEKSRNKITLKGENNNKPDSSSDDNNNKNNNSRINLNSERIYKKKPKEESKNPFSRFQLFTIKKSNEVLENLSTRELLNDNKTDDTLLNQGNLGISSANSLISKKDKNICSDPKIQWNKIFPKILHKSKTTITNDGTYQVKATFFH